MTAPTKPLPTLKRPGTAAAMIAVASSQIGVHEGHDNSGWNNDNPYGHWYGLNKQAWCAIFMSWCAFLSGCKKIIPKHAYTPSGAGWFQAHGQWHKSPKPGDLAYYWSNSMGRVHHVALVVKVFPGGYFEVGGNTNHNGSAQGDGVYKLRRSNSSVGSGGGFGRPAYARVPKGPWSLATGFPGPGAFVIGKAHPAVAPLRSALAHKGFGARPISADPVFTAEDRASVKQFQRAQHWSGADADGIPGKDTWDAAFKR